jgi:hypothetical protein
MPTRHTRLAFSVLLAVAAYGSAAQSSIKKRPVIPTSQAECEAKGGAWTTLGLPMPDKPKVCDLKAGDEGKVHTDSVQCEGVCLAPAAAEQGKVASGKCSPYLLNFGTMLLVQRRKVQRMSVE